jgi:Protein of unknown function (DUF3320)
VRSHVRRRITAGVCRDPRVEAPPRLLAAGQAEPQHGNLETGLPYQPTNFASLGVTLNKHSLYEREYRRIIQLMVDHVIRSEGPIFDEMVARRVARAHGLGRATGKLLQITWKVADPSFARSSEDGRSIVWPSPELQKLVPFRNAPKDVRDHVDVPHGRIAVACELALGSRPHDNQGSGAYGPANGAETHGRHYPLSI